MTPGKLLETKMHEDVAQLESTQVPPASSEKGAVYLAEKFGDDKSVEIDQFVFTKEEERTLGL